MTLYFKMEVTYTRIVQSSAEKAYRYNTNHSQRLTACISGRYEVQIWKVFPVRWEVKWSCEMAISICCGVVDRMCRTAFGRQDRVCMAVFGRQDRQVFLCWGSTWIEPRQHVRRRKYIPLRVLPPALRSNVWALKLAIATSYALWQHATQFSCS